MSFTTGLQAPKSRLDQRHAVCQEISWRRVAAVSDMSLALETIWRARRAVSLPSIAGCDSVWRSPQLSHQNPSPQADQGGRSSAVGEILHLGLLCLMHPGGLEATPRTAHHRAQVLDCDLESLGEIGYDFDDANPIQVQTHRHTSGDTEPLRFGCLVATEWEGLHPSQPDFIGSDRASPHGFAESPIEK